MRIASAAGSSAANDVGSVCSARRIRAARLKGHGQVKARARGRLLDGRVAAKNDQIGERYLFIARLRPVEFLPDLFKYLQDGQQLRRFVDLQSFWGA